jgi:hypothetical protein
MGGHMKFSCSLVAQFESCWETIFRLILELFTLRDILHREGENVGHWVCRCHGSEHRVFPTWDGTMVELQKEAELKLLG